MSKVQIIKIGDWAVFPVQNRLERDDRSVKLKPRTMDVLVYLANHVGEVVSTDELINTVWQGRVVGDSTVYQSINQLRKALEDNPKDANYIETIPKRGYRFVADVQFNHDSINPQRSLRWAGIAAVTLVVAGVLLVVTSMLLKDDTPALVAVMPLVNMSSHEENVYFAGGIHEEVLTKLSRIKDLQVISRTTMLRYAASDMTLREIGNALKVDYIVEGSVRRIENHVRVTVQLINARNDVQEWANNYERDLVDVFATQNELAREVSDSIQLTLQPESVGSLEGMPTTSVKAYDLYIKAVNLEKVQGETEESMIRRRAMLEEATAEDPDFVEAWAQLKRLYDLQFARVQERSWYIKEGQDEIVLKEDLRAKSQRAMNKAIALDPDNEETLLSKAVDHVWPKTSEEMLAQKMIFDQIIATYPDNAKAWYHLGWWYSQMNNLPGQDIQAFKADVAASFDSALKLDPFNARIVHAVLKWHRDYGFQSEVTRLSERLKQIIPDTADDLRLARIAWTPRKVQLVSAFLATADESLLTEYKKGWREAVNTEDYGAPIIEFWDEAELSIFTGDQDRLIELARKPINFDKSKYHATLSTFVKSIGIRVLTDRGDIDQAELVAQSILAHEEAILSQGPNACACYLDPLARSHDMTGLGALAQAYTLLGYNDKAQQLAAELVEFTQFIPATKTRVLQLVNIELAVESAFSELAKNPNWNGFDMIAAYYVFNKQILIHPKVQEYYVNEGKWIDYLAARVPTYEKYKLAAATRN